MSDKKPVDFFFDIKKNKDLAPTQKFSLQNLGDWQEEADGLAEYANASLEPTLKIDYSDFANHCFFDSAVSKLEIAKTRVLQSYPFNGSTKDKILFELSGSPYENHVFREWPRYAGLYSGASGSYITGTDYENKLYIGSSSFGVSLWTSVQSANLTQSFSMFEAMSGNLTDSRRFGFRLYFTGTNNSCAGFRVYSGSYSAATSASFAGFSASVGSDKFHNIAGLYNKDRSLVYLLINAEVRASASCTMNAVEHGPLNICIASGSLYDNAAAASHLFRPFGEKIDDIVVYHTASFDILKRTFKKGVNAESFVKLHYSFNESITGIDEIDSTVIDYSKSGVHAKIVNYNSAFTRLSSSAVASANPRPIEFEQGEPILYSFNSAVPAFTGTLQASASEYDKNNTSIIFNMVPQGLLDEDETNESLLQSFLLSMARYLDTIKVHVDQFDNIKHSSYDSYDETPDMVMPYIAKYFGMSSVESFSNVNPLQFYFGDKVVSNSGSIASIEEIRAQFWKRLLNNVPYILKSKGKKSSVEAMLNVFGINKNVIRIKEYGQPALTSIDNTRINTQKHKYMLGLGLTGSSFTASFVSASYPNKYFGDDNTFEISVILPNSSSYYANDVSSIINSGTIVFAREFTDVTTERGFVLGWNRSTSNPRYGRLFLSSTSGFSYRLTSSYIEILDGNLVSVAFGLSQSYPFISAKKVDGDSFSLEYSVSGATSWNGTIFATASTYGVYKVGVGMQKPYDLLSDYKDAQGHYGEFRFWKRVLNDNELRDHAYDIRSIGLDDPSFISSSLKFHYALDANLSASSGVVAEEDLNRSTRAAYAKGLPAGNPYKPFLIDYNFLSPSLDLKWTDNKVRIINSSKILDRDLANDTNEVSLEFNLVDALNEDMSKIFSTLDDFNNAIGAPINKYRDEYSDLEKYRRIYFQRLGDSLNFTKFFKLFTWFDKKISNAIKQLLPVRTQFIGGENVVESHFLERNKYGYKYPIFRTPATIPEAQFGASASLEGTNQRVISDESSVLRGPNVDELNENKWKKFRVKERNSSVVLDSEAQAGHNFISQFNDKDDYIPENGAISYEIEQEINPISTGNSNIGSYINGNQYFYLFDSFNDGTIVAAGFGYSSFYSGSDTGNTATQYLSLILTSSNYGTSWNVIDAYTPYSGAFTQSIYHSSHSIPSSLMVDNEYGYIYYGGKNAPCADGVVADRQLFLRRISGSSRTTVFASSSLFYMDWYYDLKNQIGSIVKPVGAADVFAFGALSGSMVGVRSASGASGSFSEILKINNFILFPGSYNDYAGVNKLNIVTDSTYVSGAVYKDQSGVMQNEAFFVCGKEQNSKLGRYEDSSAVVYRISRLAPFYIDKLFERKTFSLYSKSLQDASYFDCIEYFNNAIVVGGSTYGKPVLYILDTNGVLLGSENFQVPLGNTTNYRGDRYAVIGLEKKQDDLFIYVGGSGVGVPGNNDANLYHTRDLINFNKIGKAYSINVIAAQKAHFVNNFLFHYGLKYYKLKQVNLKDRKLKKYNISNNEYGTFSKERRINKQNNSNFLEIAQQNENRFVDISLRYSSASFAPLSDGVYFDLTASWPEYTLSEEEMLYFGLGGGGEDNWPYKIANNFSLTQSQARCPARDYVIDKTNHLIDQDSVKYFSNYYNFSLPKQDPKFTFEVSCSNAPSGFNINDLSCSLFFSSSIQSEQLTFNPFSVTKQMQSLNDGWKRYETKVETPDGLKLNVRVYPRSPVCFLSCSNTYTFRNVSFKWKEQLSPEGQQWIQKIDNQNIELHNLNVSVMKKVD